MFAIDTGTLSVIGGGLDTPYATPHNIALTPNGRKLYLAHSGGASNKVTIYSSSTRGGIGSLIGEVTVGFNPFGLAFVD